VFERAIWHYTTVFARQDRLLPPAARRAFFRRMHEDFMRYRPAGYRHPPGARGVKFAVAGVGVLLGILLAVPGISPLAAGLPGIAALGWTAAFAVSPRRAAGLIPLQGHSYAAGFGSLLTTGMLALAGAVMIVPLCIPSRWRRRYIEDDDVDIPSEMGLMR
jgi:hypothetical protein